MIDRTSFENIKISIKLPNSTDDGYYRGSVDGSCCFQLRCLPQLEWQLSLDRQTKGSGYNFVKPEPWAREPRQTMSEQKSKLAILLRVTGTCMCSKKDNQKSLIIIFSNFHSGWEGVWYTIHSRIYIYQFKNTKFKGKKQNKRPFWSRRTTNRKKKKRHPSLFQIIRVHLPEPSLEK